MRGRKKQQRGEERKQYISSEVFGPTGVLGPIVFSRSVGCVIRDISTLHSGTHNPWASLNRQHRCSCMCEPHSPLQTASRSVSHSVGTSLIKCPILSSRPPVPTGIIKTIQHPSRNRPCKACYCGPCTKSRHRATSTHGHCKMPSWTPSTHWHSGFGQNNTTRAHHPIMPLICTHFGHHIISTYHQEVCKKIILYTGSNFRVKASGTPPPHSICSS